jgi:hypothetical protein
MPRTYLSDGDRLEAKKALTAMCPFCDYEGRSNNVRRHCERFHPAIKDVVGKPLSDGRSFAVLDAAHPNIVIASAEKGDCYYKHQAYCFGCHHRILCKSKVVEKAVQECLLHECVEKQVRTTSRESSVAEPPGMKWKEVFDTITTVNAIFQPYAAQAVETDDGENDHEEMTRLFMSIIAQKLNRVEKVDSIVNAKDELIGKLKAEIDRLTKSADSS